MAVKAESHGDEPKLVDQPPREVEPPQGVVSALAQAGGGAVVIGTIVQFLIFVLAAMGQSAVIIVFDWILAPVWGLVFVVAGRWAARRALRSGRLSPVACVVFGIVLVLAVSLGCFVSWAGLQAISEDYETLLYSLHLGMVYGSIAGFLFWRIMTWREPRLLPPFAPRYGRTATLVFAGLMCVHMALMVNILSS